MNLSEKISLMLVDKGFSLSPKKEKIKFGYLIFDCAAPSTTISGALSPPIASNDKCIDCAKITPFKFI